MIETGVSARSHKGKNVSVERRMGECYQWKANGQCSRGGSCSSRHGSDRGQRAQSSSLAPMAHTLIDGRKPSKGFWPRRESRSGKKGQKACRSVLTGKCTNLSCDDWHPPVCQNYVSDSGCKFGDKCLF